MTGLLGALLPEAARTAEVFGEAFDRAPLHPEEEAVVARAVDKRRREFAAARHCARRALTALGRTPGPLLPGERGAPRWPDGVAGSMTHCDGYRAAAVADTAEIASLGIDAEPDAPLPDGVLDAIARPAERAALAAAPPEPSWDRLLFSAKEAVYKTWFPLTRSWLGFEDAELEFTPDTARSGTFRARLLTPGTAPDGRPLDVFHGRWTAARGLVVTAAAYPPAEAAP